MSVTVPGPTWWLRLSRELLRRPHLWATAVGVLLRTARPGWWRSAPFLPLPDATYLRFRMETQYGGDGTTTPDPHDVVTYIAWCRRTGTR
ncbi:MAG: hypothetical protein GX643_03810 [Acidimicrobiales bacterium]|nr:hypothetical protein [Acidimicrobiales bacterium]